MFPMCLSLQEFILSSAKYASKGNSITFSQDFLLCNEGLVSQKTFDAKYNKKYASEYGKLLILNNDTQTIVNS